VIRKGERKRLGQPREEKKNKKEKREGKRKKKEKKRAFLQEENGISSINCE
jgi:hypothetical protein